MSCSHVCSLCVSVIYIFNNNNNDDDDDDDDHDDDDDDDWHANNVAGVYTRTSEFDLLQNLNH